MTETKQTQIASVAPSLVRTGTPILVGLLTSVVADALGAQGDQVGAVIGAVAAYAYYVAARFAGSATLSANPSANVNSAASAGMK